LNEHEAPEIVDFLSIDTEGSELEILQAYDWTRPIRCIAVEHNFTEAEGKLAEFLTSKGYIQRFPKASKWDSWWIRKEDLRQL
jgi:hypothetical protein